MSLRVTGASSGGWAVIASGDRILVVDALGDSDFIESAWTAVQQPNGFSLLLDLLTTRGLAASPPFALIEWQPGGSTRVILRGEAPLAIPGADPISAAGVSTWVERVLRDVPGFAFTMPGAVPAGKTSLPLDAGVVAAAALTVGSMSGVDRAPAPVAPAPVAPAPVVPVPVVPAPPTAPVEPVEVDSEATMAGIPERETAAGPALASEVAGGDGYDFLFGDTVVRTVADAAVHEPDLEQQAASSTPIAGDHDGHTMLSTDLAKMRGSRKPRASPASPTTPEKPQALVLVVSTTGAREPLLQPILVGRAPSVSKVSGGQIPRLITISGPDLDISRNHVQVALEGGTVVVTDLHSKNGTSVVLPGKDSQRLRPGEPTAVIVGTVVDLGGGITLKVEEER